MTLPFKPHLLALLCSAGLLAAAGTLYVKSREPQTVPEPRRCADGAGNHRRSAGYRNLYPRADRPVGRANRALSGQPVVTGADGCDLSE